MISGFWSMKCNLKYKATRPDTETRKTRALHWEKPGSAHLPHELFLFGGIFREILTDVQHQHRHMPQSLEVEPEAAREQRWVKSLSFLTTHSVSTKAACRVEGRGSSLVFRLLLRLAFKHKSNPSLRKVRQTLQMSIKMHIFLNNSSPAS